jgi:hypothetical protein
MACRHGGGAAAGPLARRAGLRRTGPGGSRRRPGAADSSLRCAVGPAHLIGRCQLRQAGVELRVDGIHPLPVPLASHRVPETGAARVCALHRCTASGVVAHAPQQGGRAAAPWHSCPPTQPSHQAALPKAQACLHHEAASEPVVYPVMRQQHVAASRQAPEGPQLPALQPQDLGCCSHRIGIACYWIWSPKPARRAA